MKKPTLSNLRDTILYTVVTKPGGVDGRDASYHGGEVVFVSFDQDEASKMPRADNRYELRKSIVNKADVNAALSKLDLIELFLVQNHFGAIPTDVWRR